MLKSLKPWLNVEVTINPCTSRSGNGDKTFGTSYKLKVYPYSERTVVRNWQGEDVTSQTHLYADGSCTISKDDTVTFEGSTRPIQAIETYYRNGVPDIKVVHL